ncbi:MAG: hypothetical protein AAGA05_07980 [Pseudomonadota bacterium]
MSQPETPARVAALATDPDALDLSTTTVIGVFGPENALQALVRLPSGRVQRVKRGGRLNAARVAGIDNSGVVLSRNGRTTRLALLSR